MPKSNVKYEIASQDADTSDYFLQHVQEFQNTPKKQTPLLWTIFLALSLISVYFVFSVGLTFYQQWLLHTHEFKYPLTVVIIHLIVKYILSALVRCFLECYYRQPRVRLHWDNIIWSIVPPGITSGLDIGFSNWALMLTNISLYTMTKSTTIVFILGFALLFRLERKSWFLVAIVVMISGGLAMFTYKATEFNLLGFLLCLLASFMSGLRWTLAQMVMQKSKLGLRNPIDMMYHMQPWMMVSIMPLVLWFEGTKVYNGLHATVWSDTSSVVWLLLYVLFGACLAFFMELSEFMVVTHTSSLTLSISGIFKEMCTLALAFEWKGEPMNRLNFIGLLLCLGGITLHVFSKVLINKKRTTDDLELHSNSVTSNGTKSEDGFDTNLPLLTTQKSTSLTNLLNDAFSSDDGGGREEEDSSQVLFNILQRREQQY